MQLRSDRDSSAYTTEDPWEIGLHMALPLALAGLTSKYKEAGVSPAGFWAGFWHGLICPITFILSLINPTIRIYETSNRGRLYDFGFLVGASIGLGGSGSQADRAVS